MKFDFCIIGATGMQGKIAAIDLIKSGYTVFMCGRDKSRIEHLLEKYGKKVTFAYLDLRDHKNAKKIIKTSGSKVVINCAEGDWNIEALKIFAEAGVHSVDLGSDILMTKKQLAMNNALKKKRLIHITGGGSVPGIGNVMLHHAAEKFDSIDTVEVGFAWNSNIKKFVVPFSIQSILEEFTMIAPYLHNGKIERIKPLDSTVTVYHRAIGKQKQIKVGHHPETYTFYQYCKNKGIKNLDFYAGFPEHSTKKIFPMIELGLASKEEIDFKETKIKPVEFLTELLKKVKMSKGYTETENLWVFIKGKYEGKNRKILMECVVPPLKGWGDAGCNIDTGMPASIIAQMIYNKIIDKTGSYSPEYIVPVEPFFKELRKRKMSIYENGKVIN
ncbi:saccharopine dehydrogenase NADP-binding domain-containing protein [Candidatus Pacearchaeota archaeon]|nr:saccharopine dehydrogenase NADP-binding domain-containing protein [Candidatus Pacearchaeota archaeon]